LKARDKFKKVAKTACLFRDEGKRDAKPAFLKVVSIMLEAEDDAQIIFETFNGRGAELNATDLTGKSLGFGILPFHR
jgi:hypothetical protein